jgi:hypothetical protein
MEEVTRLHRHAMALVDDAAMARRGGDQIRASVLLREAMELEGRAAAEVALSLDLEPTRSVLYRSAASLAVQCGENRIAEQLISHAMAGNPPDEIAEELRVLWEQANFQRHLILRGVTLQPDEMQMSLSGPMVSAGMAESDQFIDRVKYINNMIYRTAERKLNRPFRERGRKKKELEAQFTTFLSVPRAASFAVSLRLGTSNQIPLPGLGFTEDVIAEVVDCLDLIARSKIGQLKERIPEDAYFANFMALAVQLSPDGEDIRSVGFTAMRGEKEQRVVLSTPRCALHRPPLTEEPRSSKELTEHVEVRGILKFADATDEKAGIIEVVDEDGRGQKVKVPPGLMADIVRPMWESGVVITGRKSKQFVLLEDIRRSE